MFQVEIGDEFPQKICSKCISTLKTFAKFRDICRQSDEKFRNIVGRNTEFFNVLDTLKNENENEFEIPFVAIKTEIDDFEFETENDDYFHEEHDKSAENLASPASKRMKMDFDLSSTVNQEIETEALSSPIDEQESVDNNVDESTNDSVEDSTLDENDSKQNDVKDNDDDFNNDNINIRPYLSLKMTGREYGKKIINCHICDQFFASIPSLRRHIEWHGTSTESFDGFDLKSRAYGLFPQKISSKTSTNAIQKTIQQMINENKSDQFYSIQSADGWELSLSDSDTDFDDDESAGPSRERYHKCGSCEMNFRRRYQLIDHMLSSVNENFEPFRCKVCKVKFPNDDILQKHLQNQCQNATKKFKCEKCSTRFMWKMNLEIHMKTAHCIKIRCKPKNCTICVLSFINDLEYKGHMENFHVPYKCPECEKRFKKQHEFVRHVKGKHDNVKFERDAMSCAYCSETQKSSYAMQKHIREKHVRPQYKCGECMKTFRYPSTIDCHIKLWHRKRVRVERVPVLCHVCGKQFSDNNQLIKHKLTHLSADEIKWYECDQCGKKFKRKDHLQSHVRHSHKKHLNNV